jgi:hypothetical protein
MDEAKEIFSEWCILELFGHKKLAGLVSEVTMAGGAFLRVDVPSGNGETEYTRFYNPSAIYSMSPVNKELAVAFATKIKEPPISRYELGMYQPALTTGSGEDDLDDY